MSKGKLYLIPTTIGEANFDYVLPSANKEIVYSLNHFIVEELRTARRFLRSYGFTKDFDNDCTLNLFNEHTDARDTENYLNPCLEGHDIGLLSEAGVPCVADPGADIVAMAHRKNIQVIPLIGPSSILLALMASGFNGQSFAFTGYLPIKPNERVKAFKQIENKVYKENQTQIFIEAPYRNVKLLQAMCESFSAETKICVACDIATSNEFIKTASASYWKKNQPDIHKKNTIFVVYK
jgi:16S rRNA (cytidine1402-2'-O)-methyltransferase